mgnify:CR=1 FL=1|jgi:hypothetical protein
MPKNEVENAPAVKKQPEVESPQSDVSGKVGEKVRLGSHNGASSMERTSF